MCAYRDILINYQECTPIPVEVSDGVINYGRGYGTVIFPYSVNQCIFEIIIENILYVPDFKFNLLSVGQLKSSGYIFDVETVNLKRSDGLPNVPVVQKRNMFTLQVMSVSLPSSALLAVSLSQ
jgi:hypothetical protein